MDKIGRIKELVGILQKASYAYYGLDSSLMTDKEYDNLYDELSVLERETNCILAGSPTIKVQGYILDGFTKVKHTKPMLSANKTKDTKEIEKFVTNNRFYGSFGHRLRQHDGTHAAEQDLPVQREAVRADMDLLAGRKTRCPCFPVSVPERQDLGVCVFSLF